MTSRQVLPPGTTIQVVDPAPLLNALEQMVAELRGLRADVAALAERSAAPEATGLDLGTQRPRAEPQNQPEKVALTYREVAALGVCSERLLRSLVASGRVHRSVLRVGRSMRFLRDELIEELRAGPPRGRGGRH